MFLKKYVVDAPVLENECLNSWVMVVFGLQENFDELVREMQRGECRGLK